MIRISVSGHFDAHAYRTEDYEGVKEFARGCMRTYLILKEKVSRFHADPQIQDILAKLNDLDNSLKDFDGPYSHQKMKALKQYSFDRESISKIGLNYEKLDQLTNEVILGVR